MTIVEQYNKYTKRNMNTNVTEKSASNYFVGILYLIYIMGFGTGLACANIASASYLIGISIILTCMLFSLVFLVRIMKGGYKSTFVQKKKDEDTGGET